LWIQIKKQVQNLNTNNTPADGPMRVEACHVFKILIYIIYICIFIRNCCVDGCKNPQCSTLSVCFSVFRLTKFFWCLDVTYRAIRCSWSMRVAGKSLHNRGWKLS
jgi:hypothetical protein